MLYLRDNKYICSSNSRCIFDCYKETTISIFLRNKCVISTFTSHSLISSNSWTGVLLHHKGRDDTAGSMQITWGRASPETKLSSASSHVEFPSNSPSLSPEDESVLRTLPSQVVPGQRLLGQSGPKPNLRNLNWCWQISDIIVIRELNNSCNFFPFLYLTNGKENCRYFFSSHSFYLRSGNVVMARAGSDKEFRSLTMIIK